MSIGEITLNLTNTTVSVLAVIVIVLYAWFTKDREGMDDRGK